MASPYTYTELMDPTSGIRLLSVTTISDGNISVSLREIPDLEPDYNCLSYSWGDPDAPKIDITCDGKIFKARQNLYDALLHLSKVQPDKMDAIWIDAICIDQGNNTEKGPQLARMHEIYHGAKHVVVWLGTNPDPLAFARFEAVATRVEQTFPEQGMKFWDKMLELNDGNKADAADVPFIRDIKAEDWLTVRDFARREYFRRQWIWQEVIASKDDPVVVCGDDVLSWQALRKASHALTIFGDDLLLREKRMPPPTSDDLRLAPMNLPYKLAWWRDQYKANGQPWMRAQFGALVLVDNRNSYVCWDERDRLWAMLGICGFEVLKDWDYGRPFEELYLFFWCYVVSKNINFLTFVQDASMRHNRPRMAKDLPGGENTAKLPSWVPDLRVPVAPTSMWWFYEPLKWLNISRDLPGRKSLTADDPINGMVIDDQNGRLKLDGYLFDTIQSTAQSPVQLLEMVRDILRDPWTEEDSHEGALGALWSSMALLTSREVEHKALVTDEMLSNARSWLLYNTDVSADGKSIIDLLATEAAKETEKEAKPTLLSELKNLDTNHLVLPSPGKTFPKNSTHDEAAQDWALRAMRLLRTKDHWIGKGPGSAKPGDEIWIVPGAAVAFVFRPLAGGNHAFVGQAYLHGVMNGEMREILEGREPVEVVLV